ncbi:MAG TPA: FGGY family carbohydrate kinase, partial [Terriglobales bacterium]|nr:FGGY family carbohydrate kinase [Terriglobales bacterium]
MHLLAIDLGSSGPKVALVSDGGAIAASATRAVATRTVGADGAEQDAEEIWRAILDAIAAVCRAAAVPAYDIAGITCASQYFSIVPVDAEARPTGPLILWMDRRGAPYARKLYQQHPEAFSIWADIHGLVPLPAGNDSLSHMLYLQHDQPALYERTAKLLEPVDYVTARLSGACVANLCTAFPLLLTDNRDLSAPAYHPRLLELAAIDRDKLPDLVPINSIVGTLRQELAEQLGLRPETTIFSGVNDTQAVSVGAGTFLGAQGGVNIGTTGQVLAHVAGKRSDFENEIVSMPSPIPGRYLAMAENGLGAKTLDHFLRNIAFASDGLADHGCDDPFAGVEAAVAAVAPGSEGALFLPWLAGSGAPSGNPHMRGGFLNVSLSTTRTHLLRAVMEGVAFNLRWLLPAVEQFAE